MPGFFIFMPMKIAIIGCGNIGKIYARTFVKYNLVDKSELYLIEKNSESNQNLLEENLGNVVTIKDENIKSCDLLLIAVKPQDFNVIAAEIKQIITKDQVVLSIMAGVTIERMKNLLSTNAIVRAMPNSPIQLGLGMTGFCASEFVEQKKLRKIEQLLSSTGRTVFFDDENKMDAVTALSGSGPAYIFYILKGLIEAGKEIGFDTSESAMLVNQTVLGAFHLMNSSTHSLDELIKIVSSKGGTTEAAMKVFEDRKLLEILKQGVVAAEKRGKELAKV